MLFPIKQPLVTHTHTHPRHSARLLSRYSCARGEASQVHHNNHTQKNSATPARNTAAYIIYRIHILRGVYIYIYINMKVGVGVEDTHCFGVCFEICDARTVCGDATMEPLGSSKESFFLISPQPNTVFSLFYSTHTISRVLPIFTYNIAHISSGVSNQILLRQKLIKPQQLFGASERNTKNI